ncbi:MAG: hypothetical protein HC866_12600 [Leptolyngbyaceae cyanobacterium RU_5_1]|nr:hypothetical protein [Leptolyngbyaceae cyanobacterium RU_5_1]
MLGSHPVEIEFQKESVFAGKVRDIATPYLGVAGLMSLGTGAVSLSIAGWRNSARKSTQIQEKFAQLQQELKARESQVEELQLSDAQLKTTGMNAFLEHGVPQQASSATQQQAQPMNRIPTIVETAASLATTPVKVVATNKPEVREQLSVPVEASVTPLNAAGLVNAESLVSIVKSSMHENQTSVHSIADALTQLVSFKVNCSRWQLK